MRILIKQIEQRAGQEVVRESVVESERASIGRDPNSAIVLQDFRVPQQRAEIRINHGKYWIYSKSGQPLWIDDNPLLEAPIKPGRFIDIGRYRLSFSKDAEYALIVEVRPRYSEAETRDRYRSRVRAGLSEAGAPLRLFAWLLFVSVLVFAGVLPAVQRYAMTDADSGVAAMVAPVLPSGLDRIWKSGPVSDVHTHFGDDCGLCHKAPFQAVGDAQCLDCHVSTVAHGKPGGEPVPYASSQQCTTCHLEHQDDRKITMTVPRLCTSCHSLEPDASVPRSAHFGMDHPEFIPDYGPGPIGSAGIGVIFSHAEHLAAEGLRGPEGDRVMSCSSCHTADPNGGFEDIRFEDQCMDCHSLGIDDENPDMVVPHGPLLEVQRSLEKTYARVALEKAETRQTGLRKPLDSLGEDERRAALEKWAQAKADDMLLEVVERRSCATCHGISKTAPGSPVPLEIDPVYLPSKFFQGSMFDHQDHRTQSCASCHGAEASESAADVLLPERAQCVSCHGRPQDKGGGLSSCLVCHEFHGATTMWPGAKSTHP